MKKNMSILIYWSVFILILLASFFSSPTSIKESDQSSDSVDVSSVYLCKVSHDTMGNIQIDICGHLIAEKDPVPLRIFIFKMPEEKLVAENPTEDKFLNGNFSRRFVLSDGSAKKYKIIIYLYREIVNETEFSIQE